MFVEILSNQGDWGPKDTNVGKETKIKVVKNTLPPKEAMVEIMHWGREFHVQAVGEDCNRRISSKSGAWYS